MSSPADRTSFSFETAMGDASETLGRSVGAVIFSTVRSGSSNKADD